MIEKPKVFSEDDREAFRREIDGMRVAGAYVAGKWMVSPLNREKRVLGVEPPERAMLRDITLRTTEQMPGVALTQNDRLRLLREIVASGVSAVQTSTFTRGHSLDEMVSEIRAVKSINGECEVSYGDLRNANDLETAARAGFDAVQFWAAPWAAASPMYVGGVYRDVWEGRDWRELGFPRNEREQIEKAVQLLERGREVGVAVMPGINMLPYASDEYVLRYSKAVADAGAKEITLFDGPSGVGPEGYAHLVRLVRSVAPNVRVGVHCHNMFDLGTACSLSSMLAGATAIEVAVNGYCAASGQADLAGVALACEAMYGVSTEVRLDRLTMLARLGEQLTGREVQWNHPVTGPEVFNWGGMDTVVQELEIDPLLHWCVEPNMVGNERRWDITVDSGPMTMFDKLSELGCEIKSKSDVEDCLERCLELMWVYRRVLTNEEIRGAFDEVVNATPTGS